MADMRIHGNLEPLASALNVTSAAQKGAGPSFAEAFSEALDEVNNLQLKADKAIEDLVTGKSKNLHETMIAMGKAQLAFKLTIQVRNKIMEAYKEITQSSV